jgi:hypothetical protein
MFRQPRNVAVYLLKTLEKVGIVRAASRHAQPPPASLRDDT